MNDRTFYVGLDLGTSELKALLLSSEHEVVGVEKFPLQVQRPHPLWSEQHPQDWWHAVEQVMQGLLQRFPRQMGQVKALGLSGQMHGAVLLDGEMKILRPAILWNDGRSGHECTWLSQSCQNLENITGNLAMPGFTAPKLLWIQQHEPAIFDQVKKVLLPKDWLRLCMTGRCVSDMSDAAGTLWLNTGLRDWSDEVLSATGMNRQQMPELVEGSSVSGYLLPELAQRWGLPNQVVVAGGGGDNAASAVGLGLVNPGQGFVSLGTSGVVFVCTDRYIPNPKRAVHAFCHAVPHRWHQMSVMLSAAGALSWATQVLNFTNEAELLSCAEACRSDLETRPMFLPYLSGERSPHNNPWATASWLYLTASHTRSDMAYAVAEGVGLGLLDGWNTLHTRDVKSLSLVGGGARSSWWGQLLSDILQVDLTLHEGGETGGALGAARLAWLATGAPELQVCRVPPVSHTFKPNLQLRSSLQKRFDSFQKAYSQLHA